MRFILFFLFVVVPIIEIVLFLQMGSWIGIPATIGLIILTAIAGTILVRSQGLDVLRKAKLSAERGEVPMEALLQGLCVLIAGALLLTPGFATDTLGFALLIPLIRGKIANWIWTLISPNIVTSGGWTAGPQPSRHNSDIIIEGEAVEVDGDSNRPHSDRPSPVKLDAKE